MIFSRPLGGERPEKLFSGFLERDRTGWEELKVNLSNPGAESKFVGLQVSATEAGAGTDYVYVSRLKLTGGPDVSRLSSLPSVVLIVVDTLRPDHLGSYGYTIRNTDAFLSARWKKSGVRFDRVYSPSCWTTTTDPSRPIYGRRGTNHLISLGTPRWPMGCATSVPDAVRNHFCRATPP